jgi:hypothetical protein
MSDDKTTVDILSLEDFRATLDARLREAEALLRTVSGSAGAQPPLGGFVDATQTSGDHRSRHTEQVDRVRRLVAAIQAARTATDTIITNYRTTEARNEANSADIAAVLGNVGTALSGGANV